MQTVRLQRLAAALIALLMANAANAQYVWLDEKGIKQFSDMAPPADVPRSRILKTPHLSPARPSPQVQPETTNDAPATPKAMTSAERNADFQKRKMEQAEKEKKEAEKAKSERDRAKYCDQVQAYYRNLESGSPISQFEKNGERTFLTDQQRAHELADTKRALRDECTP